MTTRQTVQMMMLGALLGGMVSACSAQPTPDTRFVVADLFAAEQGKSLATLELSPTPQPTATFANAAPQVAPTLPLPTVVVLRQPTQPISQGGAGLPSAVTGVTPTPVSLSCAAEPQLPFAAVWTNIPQAKAMMRCSQGGPQSFNVVWQNFERGAIFWRESDKTIFVISNSGTQQGQPTDKWWHMADTWIDGEAESDPGLTPPNGLKQPVRGIGKVWRANGFIREEIGWATGDEVPVSIQWQNFDGGWMMTAPGGAPVYVMQPLDAPPYTNGVHLAPQQ